ncbi:hypothetical protein B0F90DRAFT_373020 [Multifurca ochricompacta]|uniref:F-box domain-containing protein n=1 Tax=Multifurca ochricompacta TaxID=376703 RepID=A0AAD4QM88_9AGAM|nr:hypothetical protein B0F90DRAFT_373020 [Multifurca ochricompacta]
MCSYSTLAEFPSSIGGRLQPLASDVNDFVSGFDDVPTISSPPLEERPIKRSRVTPTDNESNNTGSYKRTGTVGRLSELPLMPLDILYEVLGHLPPSDLLSLSRMNKAFRYVIMSRRSLFLWAASLRGCGAPPCPEDMSAPAWAHLLYGGAYCYSCGAKPVTKILFSLRRRACKSCMASHLLCPSQVPQEHRNMIPYENEYFGNSIHRSRCSNNRHWWDVDVEAFCAELDSLKRLAGDADNTTLDVEATVSEFLARKKKVVADIGEHALICSAWVKNRNACRSTLLSDVRAKRFEDIKSRFLELGYSEKDVVQLRLHPEVRTSKPMSERVWQRIAPLLLPRVNSARDQRLVREGGEHYRQRRALVADAYAKVLRPLSPLRLALSPTFADFLCGNQALADAVALSADRDNLYLPKLIYEAICKFCPELEARAVERTRQSFPLQHRYMNAQIVVNQLLGFTCLPTIAIVRRNLRL